jgi:deoxyribodipyrimidine photo-lyase
MQEKQKKSGIVWFRNNLRTQDNIALKKAIEQHDQVIALFIFDPKIFEKDKFGFKKTEKYRAQFLLETITDLKANLAKLNITLLTYFEKPSVVFKNICTDFKVDAIYTQKEWTPEEAATNGFIREGISEDIKFVEDYDQFLYHPDTVSKKFENIPNVFTGFRKKLEKYVAILPENKVRKLASENLIKNHTEIPTLKMLGLDVFKVHENSAFPFLGGETEALKRVENYFFETKKVGFYKKTRNGLVGVDYSTKFSPWLANGSLSAKTIYYKIKEYEKENGSNESTYWVIFELIWRDYFKYISLKYESKLFKIGGILDRDYDWNTNQEIVQQWIEGETADDFVNANMIELKETGWMSNRGRQNVASYFAKELLLDWRIGAAYFESLLLDYDVHSNYGRQSVMMAIINLEKFG